MKNPESWQPNDEADESRRNRAYGEMVRASHAAEQAEAIEQERQQRLAVLSESRAKLIEAMEKTLECYRAIVARQSEDLARLRNELFYERAIQLNADNHFGKFSQ